LALARRADRGLVGALRALAGRGRGHGAHSRRQHDVRIRSIIAGDSGTGAIVGGAFGMSIRPTGFCGISWRATAA
jgi:hypothetical protein